MPDTIMDVSRWQGTIDWKKVKASGKVNGVMLRTVATNTAYGGIYIDPTFEKNYWGCVEAGLPVGAYCYTKAVTADYAAKELVKLKVALEGKSFQLPVAVDAEDPALLSLSPEALAQIIKMEAKQIEKWGLYAMVYTYTSFADTALAMNELTDFDLWIADYRSKRPSRKHGMWQYTNKGVVSGVNGVVDLSHAYKDYPKIIQKAGLTGKWG
nr:MAG TPA_asm: PlyB like endolysin [Caudoviricetes sp.]